MALIYFILFLSILYVFWKRAAKTRQNLPPGPWFKLPILSHIPLLGANAHTTLMKWSATYGPVITIQLGTFPTVVINDGKILKQAFASSALAGRPKIKNIDDMSLRRGMAFCDGAHSREQRRFAQKTLRDLSKTSEAMEAWILVESEDLIGHLDALAGMPFTVHTFFNRFVINSLLSVLISKKFEAGDSQLDELAHNHNRALQNNELLAVLGMYSYPHIFLMQWGTACG